MKKHINKFISTSAFEAEKEQLNQLKHFVAYDAEANKIYLKRKDIVAYDITFNVTPDDATIKYSINSTAYDQTATNGELISVNRGSTIYYKVSKNGYTEKSSNLLVQKSETITVSLDIKQFTFTINPTPSDATVKLNNEVKKSITVDYNTEVTWSVEKTGYTTQSGTTTITDDETKDVTLVLNSYDVKFNVTPSDAVIKYSIDEETYDQTATNNVPFKVNHGSTVYYRISKEGYDTITSSKLINKNETIDVNVSVTNHNVTFNVTPDGATIKYSINSTAYDQTATNGSPITVAHGSIVNYKITKLGYNDKIDSITINKDETITVSLDIKQFTFTINPTPSDATVTLNDEVKKSITVDYNTEVTWSVEKTGYTTQSGKTTVTDNETKDITLVIKSYDVKFNVTPDDATIKYSIDEETYDQTATNNVPFKVNHGSTVYYQISKEGYTTVTNSKEIVQEETIDVNITVTNHNVTFNVTPSDSIIYYSINEESYNKTATNNKPIIVAYGSTVYYKVTKVGYNEKLGNIVVDGDETITVSLDIKQFTFTINPTPSDATVKLNNEVKKSITVDYNTEVTWSVEKTGYITQSGTTTVIKNETKDVTLVIKSYDVKFNVTPENATINYSIDKETYDQTATNNVSFKVNHDSTVYYKIMADGYENESNSKLITQNETIEVSLMPLRYEVKFNVRPTDATIKYSIDNQTYSETATNNESFMVIHGSTVYYQITREGFITETNSKLITTIETIDITMTAETYDVKFNVTPSDATIKYSIDNQTYSETATNNVAFNADYSDIVYYKITREGYNEVTDYITIYNDKTISETLTPKQYTFTINPTPSDATVTLNGEVKKSITVDYNTEVTWSVEKENYVKQSGTTTVTDNETKNVNLVLNSYDVEFEVIVVPSSSPSIVIKYSIDEETYDQTATNNVPFKVNHGSTVYYKVTCDGYEDKTGNKAILKNETITVSMQALTYATLEYTTTGNSENVGLFKDQLIMDSMVKDCRIADTNEKITTYNHIFPQSGIHSVKVCWKDDLSNFNNVFSGCTKLTSIPSDLFATNSTVTSFTSTFYGCRGLTSIPEGLFNTNTEVTSFVTTFSNCSSLTTIPEDLFSTNVKITSFTATFKDCTSLTTIPSNLFSANTEVTRCLTIFDNCVNLNRVPIGLFSGFTNITDINGVFKGCTKLTKVPDNLFNGCTNVQDFTYIFSGCTSLTTIGANAFKDCTAVTSFTSTFEGCNALQTISDSAFANCSKAQTITLSGNNLQTIGNYAFKDCTSMSELPTNFNGNTNLTSIGASAFENCTSLTTFQDAFEGCINLTTIGANAFKGCSSVTSFLNAFYACNKLTSIPDGTFSGCTKATTFDSAFLNCTNLQTIGNHAFDTCSAVTSFASTFEGCVNLTVIGDYAFNNCKSIRTFNNTFNDCSEIIRIGNYAFNNCSNVSSFNNTFVCNATLQEIGKCAFANCSSLSDCSGLFSGYTALNTVDDGIFSGCTKVTNFESLFLSCSKLNSVGSNLFDGEGQILIFRTCKSMFNGCSSLSMISPNAFKVGSTVSITDVSYMFNQCKKLKEIPNSIFDGHSSLKNASYTFANSGIETIPNGLFDSNIAINDFSGVFLNCTSLTSIPEKLFAANTAVTNFSMAFLKDTNLSGVVPKDNDENPIYMRSGSGKSGYEIVTDHNACFYGCTKLENYGNIPEDWK